MGPTLGKQKNFTFRDRDSATFKMASALAFALASIAFASPGEEQKKTQEGLRIPTTGMNISGLIN